MPRRVSFAAHAVVLSVGALVDKALGGLIGLVLATAASIGFAALLQVPYALQPGINLLAFAFSAAIGVVFGFVPARLDPIETLRHE